MPPLPRGTCPVCRSEVALRKGGVLREHPDRTHAMFGVGGAVREGKVPICAGSGQVVREDGRRTTLVLEVELPEFYAEDLRPDDPDWQKWLEDVEVDPADAAAVGDEILRNIGEVHAGLLTIQVSGEKDGEVVRTPVTMIGARVEDRLPPEPHPTSEHLAEEVDEQLAEARESVKEYAVDFREQVAKSRALYEALKAARPFLGMAIPNSPGCVATGADEALAKYNARERLR